MTARVPDGAAGFQIEHADGRVFIVAARDLLGAPVEAIVSPANSGLSAGGGLAAVIADEGGPEMEAECERVIAKLGRVPVTLAVPTRAGNLPFRGIIHAVGPRMGDGEELRQLAKTVTSALTVAERRGWASVGFPAISTGLFLVPNEVCAEAFRVAVPAYWAALPESCIRAVWLCLTPESYPAFERVLRTAAQGRDGCDKPRETL